MIFSQINENYLRLWQSELNNFKTPFTYSQKRGGIWGGVSDNFSSALKISPFTFSLPNFFRIFPLIFKFFCRQAKKWAPASLQKQTLTWIFSFILQLLVYTYKDNSGRNIYPCRYYIFAVSILKTEIIIWKAKTSIGLYCFSGNHLGSQFPH